MSCAPYLPLETNLGPCLLIIGLITLDTDSTQNSQLPSLSLTRGIPVAMEISKSIK